MPNQYNLRAKDTSVIHAPAPAPVENQVAAGEPVAELPPSPGGGIGAVTQMNDLNLNGPTPPAFGAEGAGVPADVLAAAANAPA